MWAKWRMSDTKKSLPSFSSYKLKVIMKYLKKKILQMCLAYDNYNLQMIYIIRIWFILLLLHYTQALLDEQLL